MLDFFVGAFAMPIDSWHVESTELLHHECAQTEGVLAYFAVSRSTPIRSNGVYQIPGQPE